MGMRNPPHPGELIRYECLKPTESAKVASSGTRP